MNLRSIVFFLSVLAFNNVIAQVRVHNGASMVIHGPASNSTTPGVYAQRESNSQVPVMRVLEDLSFSAGSNFESKRNGELWIDGDLIREGNAKTLWKGDLVIYAKDSNQSIIGGFVDSNKLSSLLVNKSDKVYTSLVNGNVQVDSFVKFLVSGIIRTDSLSYSDGSIYANMLHILNPQTRSFDNVATIPGFENKYVEGKLNRAMLPDSTYSFPVAINPENEVFGAQIAEISPKGNVRGNALVSFTRDRGVAKNLTFEDTSCQFSVKSVLDHGWWNVDSINALASYNLRLKGDNVVNTYVNNDKSKFTIVNKNNGTDNSAYTGGIAGIDPTCGNSLYTDVYRTGLSKSSDFAIASLIDVEKFEIPNYISPNGDGSNDFFDLSALRNIIPNLRLMIYNRWGNLVYRSVGPYKNNWGGEHMLDELPLPDGVYYYLITDSEELKKTITGFVEVMRN